MDKKKRLAALTGNMQQLMYVRPAVYDEGRARGMKAYQVKNGPLSFTVMADKCLDIAEASFLGHNVSFLAKPGLMGRGHCDTNGQEALRSIMGGLLFTSGLENICAPCRSGGVDYPMHGRIRTTPAEYLSADVCWKGEDFCAQITGEMREAELFGENLVLRRKVTTRYGENRICIEDRIVNEGFRTEPMMILYHMNFGYPLLCGEAEIILPSRKAAPRDEAAAPHTGGWRRMEEPKDQEPEYVFLHEMAADVDGNTFAAIVNPTLGIGVKIVYNVKELPYFMQWKSVASGDYTVGLEPANASVYGRKYHEKRKDLPVIEPFTEETKRIELIFLAGSQLEEVKKEAEILVNEGSGLQ